MPDIPDPYEQRGTEHPHTLIDYEPGDAQMGNASGTGLPVDLADEWAEEMYAEICEREEQRKRRPPGFAAWPADA